jgi:hypothetical protein
METVAAVDPRKCVKTMLTLPKGLLDLVDSEAEEIEGKDPRGDRSKVIRKILADHFGRPDLAEVLPSGRPRNKRQK